MKQRHISGPLAAALLAPILFGAVAAQGQKTSGPSEFTIDVRQSGHWRVRLVLRGVGIKCEAPPTVSWSGPQGVSLSQTGTNPDGPWIISEPGSYTASVSNTCGFSGSVSFLVAESGLVATAVEEATPGVPDPDTVQACRILDVNLKAVYYPTDATGPCHEFPGRYDKSTGWCYYPGPNNEEIVAQPTSGTNCRRTPELVTLKYEQSYDDRYEEGFDDGFDFGFDSGFGDGFDFGFDEGVASTRCSTVDGVTLELDAATVSVTYGDAAVAAHVAPAGCTAEYGAFTFFDPDRPEVVVRLLDGCAVNGHHWLSAVSMTTLDWRATFTRGEESVVVTAATPLDTAAFACE